MIYIENPGKIPENSGTDVSTPLFLLCDECNWLLKHAWIGHFFSNKKNKDLFWWLPFFVFYVTFGQNVFMTFDINFLGRFWWSSGKNPSHTQKFACPYIYGCNSLAALFASVSHNFIRESNATNSNYFQFTQLHNNLHTIVTSSSETIITTVYFWDGADDHPENINAGYYLIFNFPQEHSAKAGFLSLLLDFCTPQIYWTARIVTPVEKIGSMCCAMRGYESYSCVAKSELNRGHAMHAREFFYVSPA